MGEHARKAIPPSPTKVTQLWNCPPRAAATIPVVTVATNDNCTPLTCRKTRSRPARPPYIWPSTIANASGIAVNPTDTATTVPDETAAPTGTGTEYGRTTDHTRMLPTHQYMPVTAATATYAAIPGLTDQGLRGHSLDVTRLSDRFQTCLVRSRVLCNDCRTFILSLPSNSRMTDVHVGRSVSVN